MAKGDSFREEDLTSYSPVSRGPTMELQLIAKLASLESAMSAGFRRLDEKMDRFQSDLHDAQLVTNDRINQLDKETTASFALKRARIDEILREREVIKRGIEDRLIALETWTQVAMAKVGVITTAVAIIWIVAAPTIRNLIGIAPG